LKLAEKLACTGIKIISIDYKSLDLAKDSGSLSNLLKQNNIPYPNFGVIEVDDSYENFPKVTKELGPEMKSTGEAIYFIDDLTDEFFHTIYSERNLYLSK